MLTRKSFEEALERARDCLAGKSRSNVEDARVFAKVLLEIPKNLFDEEDDCEPAKQGDFK